MAKDTYRICGIDPGTNILGYAILEVSGNAYQAKGIGVIYLKHLSNQSEKLRHIFERTQQLIRQYRPTQMAVEAPFYGKNAQAMLKLGRAQGVAIAAAMMMELEVEEYAPRKIKQSVTGKGNASKEQVAAMLETTLQLKFEGKYLDASDALAVAVCHYHQSRSPLTGGKRYSDWDAFLKANPERGKP